MTPSGSRQDRPAEYPLRAVEVSHEGRQWVKTSKTRSSICFPGCLADLQPGARGGACLLRSAAGRNSSFQTGTPIARSKLTDYERAANRPMLPNKPRSERRVDDRRTLNGTFWVLRSGAPWRDPSGALAQTPPALIASFAGEGLAFGARSCTHSLPLTTGCADDRYLHCARAPARGLYRRQWRTMQIPMISAGHSGLMSATCSD